MSEKKNLLNESQVRQFMKLASLGPLTPGFVHGLTERPVEGSKWKSGRHEFKSRGNGQIEVDERRQTRPPGGGPGGGGVSHGRSSEPMPHNTTLMREEPVPPEEEVEFATDDLEGGSPEEDVEAGVDLDVAAEEEGEEVGADEPSLTVAQVVRAIEVALEELLPNEEVSAEYVADEPEVDVEAEDEFAPEGDAVVPDIEVGEEELEETPMYEAANTDELVEQITKRVAARILKSALSKK
jgi:hypothetical protein